MISMSPAQYERGECTVDGETVELTHRKIPWASVNAYGRQKVEILRVLLEAEPSAYVARDEVMAALWPEPDDEPEYCKTIVGCQIVKLRRLLGSDRIETKYRQGWRIVQ